MSIYLCKALETAILDSHLMVSKNFASTTVYECIYN